MRAWQFVEQLAFKGYERSIFRIARKKIAQVRDVNLALNFSLSSAAQNTNDFARRNPRRDVIYFGILDGAIAIDDEDRWLGDASPFLRIVNAPILDHPPHGITQGRKRQPQLAPQRFRFRQRIDGSGHHVGPRADFRVMIAVSRQLAETKWSPGAAIEKKHHTALRN